MKTGRKFWLAVSAIVLFTLVCIYSIKNGVADSSLIQMYFMISGAVISIAIGGNVGEHFVKGMVDKVKVQNGKSD